MEIFDKFQSGMNTIVLKVTIHLQYMETCICLPSNISLSVARNRFPSPASHISTYFYFVLKFNLYSYFLPKHVDM
jgi:hypothetical protein